MLKQIHEQVTYILYNVHFSYRVKLDWPCLVPPCLKPPQVEITLKERCHGDFDVKIKFRSLSRSPRMALSQGQLSLFG